MYLEAATWHASLRRLSLNGDELFDRFAEPGFLELSVGEIEQADDNRSRRPCCFLIGAHHVRGGRLSGRTELRDGGAALGDQAISGKIRLTNEKHINNFILLAMRNGIGSRKRRIDYHRN